MVLNHLIDLIDVYWIKAKIKLLLVVWCSKGMWSGVKEERAGKGIEGEGRKRERGIDWNMQYLHVPDMRVSTISWSVECVKCISVRMEMPCNVRFLQYKEGNWFSIHTSALSFTIKGASILVWGPEMWWQHTTFTDSE